MTTVNKRLQSYGKKITLFVDHATMHDSGHHTVATVVNLQSDALACGGANKVWKGFYEIQRGLIYGKRWTAEAQWMIFKCWFSNKNINWIERIV